MRISKQPFSHEAKPILLLKSITFWVCFALCAALSLSACKSVKTPEQTARSFFSAIDSKDFAKARGLSTEKTHEMIKMLQSLAQMQTLAGVLGAKVGGNTKLADIQKISCTENGDRANCAYCCNGLGQSATVQLVRDKKKKWLVDMSKENAINLDMGGGNAPQIPNIPPPPMPEEYENKASNDSLPPATPQEIATRFVKGLATQDYFEIQNLSSNTLHNRIAQSMIAEQVLGDSMKQHNQQLADYKFAKSIKSSDGLRDSCIFKTKGKPDVTVMLGKDYDGEWRVNGVLPANLVPKPDQNSPESVAAYFITYLLNGSWDDAEALSTPETSKTISFLTRTAMNRPESFDDLAKLQCLVNNKRASCTYCCNPLNNEDTIILIQKDEKWWVEWKLK